MMVQKKRNYSTFLIISISILIGFLAGYIAGFRYGIKSNRAVLPVNVSQRYVEPVPAANLSPDAVEIIKELNCICGCKMELLPCTCEEVNGSKEIKYFVQALVDEGMSKPDVIQRVVNKYGRAVVLSSSS